MTGSRPAAVAGEGIEFAELRTLEPGERARRVNWRASAARGRLLVNDRLPERSSDVVLFLDALGTTGTSAADTAVYTRLNRSGLGFWAGSKDTGASRAKGRV